MKMYTACAWLLASLLTASLAAAIADEDLHIVVNQAGYTTHWPKQALLLSAQKDETDIHLIDASSGKQMATLAAADAIFDEGSQRYVRAINFDDYSRPGRYRLQAKSYSSPTFSIAESPYDKAMYLLVRSYFLQRCGIKLNDRESGLTHEKDHIHDGILRHDDEINPAGKTIIARGGWHDAGDFGKYMATTPIAVSRLLDLYETQAQNWPDGRLNIPESKNKRSDLLDEALVGLEWMLTMQRSDGAVYRKLSGASWPKAITPDTDKQIRYIYGVSSPDTAKFAAVMAQAARVWPRADYKHAERFLLAAEQAWEWLKTVRVPQQVDWQANDDSGSGKYLHSHTDTELSLLTDRDDRIWAAAELWLTTRRENYLDYLKSEDYLTGQIVIAEWKNPAAIGVIHLLNHASVADIPPDLHSHLRAAILEAAHAGLERSRHSAYALANDRFIWGSNKMAAEEGILLAQAYRLSGDEAYRKAAIAQLDFVLGRNPQGLSFLSAVGQNSVKNVAHLYGRAQNKLIPGLFVGGANSAAQDGIAPKNLGIMSYIDDARAYSVNEYAIDYNAALIGLINVLQEIDRTNKKKSARTRR
jgi:endoglucanase